MITYTIAAKRIRRPGFTLIELLVVISLIVVLATLGVAFGPSLRDRQRASQGVSSVQGWFMVSKQWALRDQAPRGIRLQPDALNMVTTLQYIEQPDDFSGGQLTTIQTNNAAPPTVTATFTGNPDFMGGLAAGDPNAPVLIGDYLEVPPSVSDQLFRITGVAANSLTIQGPPGIAPSTPNTIDYRIVRQPRPRTGEGPLELPTDVAIDLNPNLPAWYNNPLNSNAPNGAIDILFAPSGEVISPSDAPSMIQLWVRETTTDWDTPGHTFKGNQVLVTIYRRTGMITSNNIDVSLTGTNYTDPYSFTRDGQGSGM